MYEIWRDTYFDVIEENNRYITDLTFFFKYNIQLY
jgi:hypothetical protein